MDKIKKQINNFEEKEDNKIKDLEKKTINKVKNNNKMIVNIPDYLHQKDNIDNFLGLCGTYEKYNYEFSKIKNLFIIKNMLNKIKY